ncbi:MAG: hypothetical protein JXP34_16335 [Planctomycetes bacterium]|nr:hypothetical protein [Planctomycetota bacterium]
MAVPARIAIIAALSLAGCASYSDRLEKVHQAFYAGDLPQAEDLLEGYVRDAGRDQGAYALELGIVKLALGKTRESEVILRKARDRLEDEERGRPTDYLAAALLDDRSLPYAGEDHEKIMVRAMLGLVNLLNGGDDAIAYANQVFEKQREIQEEIAPDGSAYKKDYKFPGIGPYLRAILAEADFRNYDTALRNYERLKELEPGYARVDEDIERVRDGVHAAPGNGVLYVHALVGQGPRRIEVDDEPSTTVLNLAEIILAAAREEFVTFTVVPIRVPEVVVPPGEITEVLVSIGGQSAGATSTITDVGAIALQQFAEVRDWIHARAFLRRVLKRAMIETGRRIARNQGKSHEHNLIVDIIAQIVSIIYEAAERADTRCWSLLPREIQTLRVELREGIYDIGLASGAGGTPRCAPQHLEARIDAGRDTHILVFALDGCVPIPPLCSNSPPPPAL